MVIQPFIGNLCDRYDKKKVNGILLAIAGIFGIVFILANNIYMIAIVYSVVLAILNGVNPIIERMATVSKHKYGLIRIWGTIGYASGSQVSGLIYRYISPEAMYQHNGLTVSQATTVIFAGTMMELPVILLSRFYMNKIGNKQLLMLSFLLLVVQFMTYAYIPNVVIQIIITFLTKSVTTIAFIMINMKVIATIIDGTHQMSALSIVSTFKSFSSIIFQAIAGYLIDLYSYQFFYGFLFVCAIIGLVLCILYKIPSGNEHRLFD